MNALEKMARAICCPEGCQAERDNAADRAAGRRYAWDRPCSSPVAMDCAKAALQSLKDLDEGTVEAMAQELRDARDYTDRAQALRAFTAAIDHILKSGEP